VAQSFNNSNNISDILKFPYLLLAVSIFITVGITYNFYQSARNKDLIRFTNEISRVQSTIDNKINLYVALLKGGRGFVESSVDLNRKSFANYVESLNLEQNYAGVQSIGYNKIVPALKLNELVEQMKAEGFADFKVFPATNKDFYQAIIYLEPSNEKNQKEIGFDMSTETNRRTALERAADSGKSVATGKINLVNENEIDSEPRFIIYLPIYKNNHIPNSIEERRKNLVGYIFSPFGANEFLREIQKTTAASGISVKIYDGELKPENLLSQTIHNDIKNFVGQMDNDYTTQKELAVEGRKWIIEYNSLPNFTEQSSVAWTPLIFLGGIIFSFLLFGMTYWETSARIKLQSTATKLLESETQKQALFENEQKARFAAEQANSTKDEFIAVVSHELRTPLNAIAGWIRILRTDNLSYNTKKLALEKIDRNLRLQTKLVEELLNYSEILSGNIYIGDKKVDFCRVFDSTFQEIESKAREKSIEFVKDNQLNGHHILGDEDKIRLVIYNILINAIKFTHSGGKVEAQALENEGNIQLSVKDNGRGISPEFLPYIFDRFSQADTSSTRSFGGLGLGLTISNHIVKLHKGVIEADSEGLNKGSTFTMKIPFYKG
jgi:signal transduction histidine kinase